MQKLAYNVLNESLHCFENKRYLIFNHGFRFFLSICYCTQEGCKYLLKFDLEKEKNGHLKTRLRSIVFSLEKLRGVEGLKGAVMTSPACVRSNSESSGTSSGG